MATPQDAGATQSGSEPNIKTCGGSESLSRDSQKKNLGILDQSLHSDTADRKQDEDDCTELGEPFFFVKWLSQYPRLSFGVALGVHVFFLGMSGVLMVVGYDLFPVNFDTLPMELHDQPWFKRDLAWQGRNQYRHSVHRQLPASKYPTWDRALTTERLLLFYDAGRGGNIFTKDNLRLISTIESRLTNVSLFSSFCQMTQAGTCTPPVSVLRFFDGTFVSVDPVFNDTNFDKITAVLFAASHYNETKGAFAYALGKDNAVTRTYVSATLTRTLIPFGWPLSRYGHPTKMCAALDVFMAEYMKPILDDYLDDSMFDFVYYNQRLMLYEVREQAFHDMGLAIGSMVFIFGFILFHTRSLFVTSLSVLSIVCSFVETNLIYRVVIGYKYFGYFHVLAMFIILGVGADDLFVFWDAWQATGLKKYPSLAHRLNEAYHKSVISMFVTSMTTMIAFLVNAASPLLTMNSFGVFSAILIGIDYLSVVTFIPTIVIMYHVHFENKPHPCCCCWNRTNTIDKPDYTSSSKYIKSQMSSTDASQRLASTSTIFAAEEDTLSASREVGTECHAQNVCYRQASVIVDTSSINVNQNATVTKHIQDSFDGTTSTKLTNINQKRTVGEKKGRDSKEEKPSRLVIFFRDYYLDFVTHRTVRWIIVVVLLGCLVGLAFSASTLEPDHEQIQLYTDSHYYSRAVKYNNHGFVANDMQPTVAVYLVWGLRERNLDACNFSQIMCPGEEVYDESFDASTEAAQNAFVKICDVLLNFTAKQVRDFRMKRDLVTGELEVACFPQYMEAFLKNDPALNGLDVTMPWNWTQTSNFMTSLNTSYNATAFDSNFKQFLDIPLTYWIRDGFNQNLTKDYQIFNSLFGEELDTYSTKTLTTPPVMTGNKIKYMAIAVNTTLSWQALGYTEGIPVAERWEQFMKDQTSNMPREMQGGFQTTLIAWHWLYMQQSLVDNAILGVALGVSLAFPVLVLSTGNVINGLLATLTICCVSVCVIGVIPLAGWRLGLLVSLNMCLAVGLAVDYVVHLAEGYHMAQESDRKGRLRSALERMGISVFSGACTTLGASAFMLFAKIQFFFQFGIFMFCTIGFSLVFSMGLYVTVMGILGPEGDVGDIRVFFRKCCARMKPNCRKGTMHSVSKTKPSNAAVQQETVKHIS